jgi:putative phage-type endonuclease
VKIHNCEQNTPEWRMLRAGIPTASAFDKIVTPTGKASSQQEKYKFRLLAERIMGHPIEDHRFTWAMERGSALEKKALEYYRFQTDYQTTPVGFITDDEERWGASPDQFVGEDGCLEIKCPKIDTHMMYLMNEGSAYDAYRVQAQGQLWVSGRKWTDFLSYHPDLPWSLVRVERDEEFIAKIAAAVMAFSDELEALARRAADLGWFRQVSTRRLVLSERDQLLKDMRESLIEFQKG